MVARCVFVESVDHRALSLSFGERNLLMLVEVDGCVFDQDELAGAHGHERLDPIGKEAFVNHIHLDDAHRQKEATEKIASWTREMKQKWPTKSFRIYRHVDSDEITIRFHMVRGNSPNWAESGLEIIEINAEQRHPADCQKSGSR